MQEWLKHAFAVDPPGPAEPDESERQVIEAIASEVVNRRMTAPALMVLEMGRPLNFVTAQALTFFQPFLAVVADTAAYDRFTRFLERRGAVEYIAGRIEAIDEARRSRRAGSPGAAR